MFEEGQRESQSITRSYQKDKLDSELTAAGRINLEREKKREGLE